MILPSIILVLVVGVIIFLIVYVTIDRKYTDRIVNLELTNEFLNNDLKEANNKFESVRKTLNDLKQDLDKKVTFIKDQNNKIFKLETEVTDLNHEITLSDTTYKKDIERYAQTLQLNLDHGIIADSILNATCNTFFECNKKVYISHMTHTLDVKMLHIPRNPFKFDVKLNRKLLELLDPEITEILTELDVVFRDFSFEVRKNIRKNELNKVPQMKWKDNILNNEQFTFKINKFVRENFDLSDHENIKAGILTQITLAINIAVHSPIRTIVNKLNGLDPNFLYSTAKTNSRIVIDVLLNKGFPIYYIIPYHVYLTYEATSKNILTNILK